MQIMDGKKIAEKKFLELKKEIEENKLSLSLAIIKTLKDPVSEIYVKSKKKTLEKNGIDIFVYNLKENVSEEKLKSFIANIKEDGVLKCKFKFQTH